MTDGERAQLRRLLYAAIQDARAQSTYAIADRFARALQALKELETQ